MSVDVRGALVLYYSYRVTDRKGRVVRHRDRVRSKSFVQAFLQHLYLKMGLTGTATITDTGNTSRSGINPDNDMVCEETAGALVSGIILGTGTTAVAIDDYAIETVIAEGTGAGQMQYGASTVNQPSNTAALTSMIMSRDISNASGGTITVKEVALYGQIGQSGWAFCLVRDNVNIAVTNGQQLTFNYEWQTPV